MGLNIESDGNFENHLAYNKFIEKSESEDSVRCYYNNSINSIFKFSNENLEAIFNDRNLKNKRVVTVGSSGDQVLFSILHGSKDITLIDANPLTQPYVELKMSAIKNLSYSEFLDFFSEDTHILSNKYYAKISHDLSEYSKFFWDNIYLDLGDESRNFLLLNLFQGGDINDKDAFGYCNDMKTYYKLKEMIDDANVKFKVASLENFNEILEGKYHLILLSNVLDYVNEDEYLKSASDIWKNHLKWNGDMQLQYDFLGAITGSENLSKKVINTFKKKNITVLQVEDIRHSSLYKECPSTKKHECSVIFV